MASTSSIIASIAGQVLPLIHLILACIATAIILRKRRELPAGLSVGAFLVSWLVPLLGPSAVLIGLRRPPAVQP